MLRMVKTNLIYLRNLTELFNNARSLSHLIRLMQKFNYRPTANLFDLKYEIMSCLRSEQLTPQVSLLTNSFNLT